MELPPRVIRQLVTQQVRAAPMQALRAACRPAAATRVSSVYSACVALLTFLGQRGCCCARLLLILTAAGSWGMSRWK